MRSPEFIQLQESAETRPNRYAAKVLLYIAAIALLFLFANELNILHVSRNIMRVSVLISLFFLILPSWMVLSEKRASNPKCKYRIMLCVIFATVTLTVMLSFHATLVLVFPIFLATLYRSRKIGYIACAASAFSAVVAPLLSYWIGTWNYEFGGWIMETYYGHSFSVVYTDMVSTGERMKKIILFHCAPSLLLLLAFSFIVFSVLKRAEKDYENQVQIIRVGETDSLTGLLNRHCYDSSIDLYQNVIRESLTCIYIDCNGLHELNNMNGHAKGDEFLIKVANVLKQHFGEDECYRIGGDEFVAFQADKSLAKTEQSVSQIKAQLQGEGYSISAGISCEKKGYPVLKLIKKAEEMMYTDKRKHYAEMENR